MKMKKYLDWGSSIVIALTFILFTLALFTTGFTHDLLLEAGVLLVSIKLIMMGYTNSVQNKELRREIDDIKRLIVQAKEEIKNDNQ